jgi:hypothetical protein
VKWQTVYIISFTDKKNTANKTACTPGKNCKSYPLLQEPSLSTTEEEIARTAKQLDYHEKARQVFTSSSRHCW